MSKYEPYDPTNAPIEDPRKWTRLNLDRIFKRNQFAINENNDVAIGVEDIDENLSNIVEDNNDKK